MHRVLLTVAACLALFAAGCGDDSSTTAKTSATTTEEQSASPAAEESAAEKATEEAEKKTKPKVSVAKGAPPSKLVVKEIEKGTGPAAKAGDEVSVHYVGVLYESGKEFEASWDRNEPIVFPLGSNAVIQGWEQGLKGMKVGGRRELIIPPKLAYGSQAAGPIPANSTLVFVVDLQAIN